MKKHIITWKFIYENMLQEIPVMLLYVLESEGSSPGRQGFFMAVNVNGQMEGSIGGGIMEHKFVELAKSKLKAGEKEKMVRKQVHRSEASVNRSGMICSGEQTNLICHIDSNEISHVKNIINCLQNNGSGTLSLSPLGLSFSEVLPDYNYEYHFKSDEDWYYKEKIGYKNKLYIIGGGPSALALCRLMASMDFYISAFTIGEESKTNLTDTYADQKIVLNDFNELGNYLTSVTDNYIVVMSKGCMSNITTVSTLLNYEFKYLGLSGSQKEADEMFSRCREEGVPEGVLSRIHAPVGLQTNSQSPEEIAISIAAEIIGVKNG